MLLAKSILQNVTQCFFKLKGQLVFDSTLIGFSLLMNVIIIWKWYFIVTGNVLVEYENCFDDLKHLSIKSGRMQKHTN